MLQMGSRTFTVDGVTVYADHADPDQFWYLPAPVALARRGEDKVPQLTMIKYKPAVAGGGVQGGGFLMFETELALDPDTERRVRSHARQLSEGEPRLTPVPFDSGTVQRIALNLQGPGGTVAQPPADSDGTGFTFVQQILGASKPSLQGNNTAAFSLKLDQAGATVLEQAFRERGAPVGVIYDLKFTALRPALDVEITADFKRMFDSLHMGLQFGAAIPVGGMPIYLKAGLDWAFEKLKQDGAIQIKVVNSTGSADEADQERWALEFFKQTLMPEWFKPTLAPVQFQPGGGVPIPGAGGLSGAGGVARPPAGGGAVPAPPPGGGPVPAPPPGGGAVPAPAPGGGAVPAPPPGGGAVPAPPPGGGAAPAPPPGGGAVPAPPPGGGAAPAPPPGGGAVPAPPPGGGAAPAPPPGGGPVPAPRPGGGPVPAPAPGGGQAGQVGIGLSFQLQKIEQEELKTLSFKYNRIEAVEQQYAPQGFIGLLAGDLGPGHFIEVDLDDPFFRTIPILVEAPGDFGAIGLHRVDTSLFYGRPADPEGVKQKDFTFTAGDVRQQQHTFSLNKRRELGYDVQVGFHFDPQADWHGERNDYEFPPRHTDDRTLIVHPFDQFEFREIRLVPGDLDPSAVTSTDVRLRYADPQSFTVEDVITVQPAGPPQVWRLRLTNPDHKEVTYVFEHHLVDGSTQQSEPQTTSLSSITINDPFPDALELDFIPTFAPGSVQTVFADILYEDPAHSYRREATLTFDGASPKRQSVRIALFDANRRTYHLSYTILAAGGGVRRLEQDTDAERLFVGETF